MGAGEALYKRGKPMSHGAIFVIVTVYFCDLQLTRLLGTYGNGVKICNNTFRNLHASHWGISKNH